MCENRLGKVDMLPITLGMVDYFENRGLCWDVIQLIGKSVNKHGIMLELKLSALELNLMDYGDVGEVEKIMGARSVTWVDAEDGFTCCGTLYHECAGRVTFLTHMSDWCTNRIIYATVLGQIDRVDRTVEIRRSYHRGIDPMNAVRALKKQRVIDDSYTVLPRRTQRKWTSSEHKTIMYVMEDKFDPIPPLIDDDEDEWIL